jgi:hypothetical protein
MYLVMPYSFVFERMKADCPKNDQMVVHVYDYEGMLNRWELHLLPILERDDVF